jgi:hypothetical protein
MTSPQSLTGEPAENHPIGLDDFTVTDKHPKVSASNAVRPVAGNRCQSRIDLRPTRLLDEQLVARVSTCTRR